MTSVTFQILNISLLTVVCFMLIQANPHSEYFKTCNDEIKNLNPAPSTRRPCIMACVGVKEGWVSPLLKIAIHKTLKRNLAFSTRFFDTLYDLVPWFFNLFRQFAVQNFFWQPENLYSFCVSHPL